MKNNQKGITLVALVITIIVLLILAAVTIATLSGDNGILNRTTQAKQLDELGQAKDKVNLAINEGMTEFYNTTYVEDHTGTAETLQKSTYIINAIDTLAGKSTKVIGKNEDNIKLDTEVVANYSGKDSGKVGNVVVSKADNVYTLTTSDGKKSVTLTITITKDNTNGQIKWEDKN